MDYYIFAHTPDRAVDIVLELNKHPGKYQLHPLYNFVKNGEHWVRTDEILSYGKVRVESESSAERELVKLLADLKDAGAIRHFSSDWNIFQRETGASDLTPLDRRVPLRGPGRCFSIRHAVIAGFPMAPR